MDKHKFFQDVQNLQIALDMLLPKIKQHIRVAKSQGGEIAEIAQEIETTWLVALNAAYLPSDNQVFLSISETLEKLADI